MQHTSVTPSCINSHFIHARKRSRKRCFIRFLLTSNMPHKSVRWAFNFTKWNPSHSDMLLATSCIQPEEKARLAKFVFKNDVKSSLIGRLMMRKFVAESTRQGYDIIRFVRDDRGKPLLANNCHLLNYNVSHQGDFTVLAGAEGDLLLGVDVMKVEMPRGKRLKEYFRIMSRTFSSSEWETITDAGSDQNQMAMFCRHWCLKESYLKAVGVGITINLQDVSFKINSKMLKKNSVVDDTEVYFKGEKLDWEFQEMLLDDNHCVAVALSSKPNPKVAFEEISYGDLMKNSVPLSEQDVEYCNNFFKKEEKT